MVKTVMLVLGGHDSRDAMAKTVDVVSLKSALRALVDTCGDGEGFELVVPDIGVLPETIAALREGMQAPVVHVVADVSEMNAYAMTHPLSAIVVMGGDAGLMALADEIKLAKPEALLVPVASTGGAAAALFAREPSAYDRKLASPYPSARLFSRWLEAAPDVAIPDVAASAP